MSIFKNKDSLAIQFNEDALAQFREAERALGLISDIEAIQYATSLLQAATIAKQNGLKLAIVNDKDQVEATLGKAKDDPTKVLISVARKDGPLGKLVH